MSVQHRGQCQHRFFNTKILFILSLWRDTYLYIFLLKSTRDLYYKFNADENSINNLILYVAIPSNKFRIFFKAIS